MPSHGEPRVAVYFDFDNIVISRYEQLHGRNTFFRDVRGTGDAEPARREAGERLRAATVDVNAVLDYATTFGSLAICRAYADWSHPVNSAYRDSLTARAVDTVQMFPLSVRRKNGADIRLAVDAMEDLFLLDDVTHVVIVAGDSDFVPLVQKTRRLGRYVVGIGVAGGTSRILAGACDEYADYDSLLTDEDDDDAVDPVDAAADAVIEAGERSEADSSATSPSAGPRTNGARAGRATRVSAAAPAVELQQNATASAKEPVTEVVSETDADAPVEVQRRRPGPLLRKALLLLETKNDTDWQPASAVKNQMLRMDPSFNERELGFASFTEFVQAYPGVVELDTESGTNRIRRRPGAH